MPSFFYNHGLAEMQKGTIDIDTDTIKLMLVANTTVYTPNKDDVSIDAAGANDPIDAETVATNYAGGFGGAGRKTVACLVQKNDTDDRVDMELNGGVDLTWTSLGGGTNETIVGAILVKENTDDTDSLLIAFFDIADTTTNGGDFTLQMTNIAGGGNLRITT